MRLSIKDIRTKSQKMIPSSPLFINVQTGSNTLVHVGNWTYHKFWKIRGFGPKSADGCIWRTLLVHKMFALDQSPRRWTSFMDIPLPAHWCYSIWLQCFFVILCFFFYRFHPVPPSCHFQKFFQTIMDIKISKRRNPLNMKICGYQKSQTKTKSMTKQLHKKFIERYQNARISNSND